MDRYPPYLFEANIILYKHAQNIFMSNQIFYLYKKNLVVPVELDTEDFWFKQVGHLIAEKIVLLRRSFWHMSSWNTDIS